MKKLAVRLAYMTSETIMGVVAVFGLLMTTNDHDAVLGALIFMAAILVMYIVAVIDKQIEERLNVIANQKSQRHFYNCKVGANDLTIKKAPDRRPSEQVH